eukprot:gene19197-biopygen3998
MREREGKGSEIEPYREPYHPLSCFAAVVAVVAIVSGGEGDENRTRQAADRAARSEPGAPAGKYLLPPSTCLCRVSSAPSFNHCVWWWVGYHGWIAPVVVAPSHPAGLGALYRLRGRARDVHPIHRNLSWMHTRSAIAGCGGLDQ